MFLMNVFFPLITILVLFFENTVALNCYNCNQDTQGCGDPVNTSLLQNNQINCSDACVVYVMPFNQKIYRGCAVLNDTGSAGTGRWSNGISYNYCRTELCNTVPPPFLCYSCYSNDAGCDDPVDTTLLKNLVIPCTGACLVYRLPVSNKIYRGCTNNITSLLSQTTTISFNYCQTNLCNNITAPASPTTTTQSTTTSATTRPVTIDASWLVTWTEFTNAVVQNGYPAPTQDQYYSFVSQLTTQGGITSKREAAMFLAQIMWESDGLRAKREYACLVTGCPGTYGSTQYSQSYYGRGYIQLSWTYNYGACSSALFGDDRLLRDPDQVASNENIAWASAFWYWKNFVATSSNVKNGWFGSSTMAINGGLECYGSYQDRAKKRFGLYTVVMVQFGLTETPIESGCYN